MTAARRGRRTVIQRRIPFSHPSAAATLGAELAGARRHRRRAHRKSPVPRSRSFAPWRNQEPYPQPTAGAAATRGPDPSNTSIEPRSNHHDPDQGKTDIAVANPGADPITCEELPRETVLQHADVLRALLAGLTALEQTAARAQRRAQLPDNVGRAWTTDEESRLVAAFKSGDSPIVIAHQHGRTLRAIEARLEKLGLITAEQRTTRGGFTGVG